MKLSILRAETKSIVKVSFYGVVIKIMLPTVCTLKTRWDEHMANEPAGFHL